MNLQNFYAHQNKGFALRHLLLIAYTLVVVIYFSWRITIFNTTLPIFSTIFFAAELATLMLALMSILILWKTKSRLPAEAPKGLKVDVFVPTYNESMPLVRRTVIAAKSITYPHETFLLDDGDRPEMKELAENLGCHYLRRDTNRGAKPGNLNEALPHSKADFIAVIDCDHIAQRDYLDRLLGYFSDSEIAFVQAPQDYYNTDAFQYRNDPKLGLLWHDQTSFFSTGQAGRDYRDATTCCGTSTIVRRSVIDEMGGFPEETVTEDIHVAIKAQKLGYKSVYYPMPLAYGVAPVDLGEFQKQRFRWGQGNVRSIWEEGLPFTGKLTFAQNVCYTYLGFMYAEGWARLVFYLAPPFVIFTGLMPIAPTHDFLWYFVPFFLITALFFEEIGRGHHRFHMNEQMVMARFPVFIASTFAIFRKHIKWQVSSKEFIGHFQLYLLAPQLAVLALNFVAAIMAMVFPNPQLIAEYSFSMYVFGIGWCIANCILAAGVILNAIRCTKNKRADYRFSLQLPFSVSVDRANAISATTNRISAAGMSFTTDVASKIRANSKLSGNLYLPGFTIPFHASIEADDLGSKQLGGQKPLIRCEFEWTDEAMRDRLDLSLHACVWHRRIQWDGDHFLTPLEWIAKTIGIRKDQRTSMENHRAILYAGSAKSKSDKKLGLLLPGEGEEELTLVTFQPMKLGKVISVAWVQGLESAPEKLKIGKLIKHEEVASAGPDDVKMYTYSASRL